MAMDSHMEAAFSIAKTADFSVVRPNPLVGAVVVSSDGRIIGKGCHEQFGQSHAEVNAINNALKKKNDLSDCALYVTLEPCSHQGKTPPCTELIKKHRIRKVVIGSSDPNPLVSGISILRDAGIEVELHNHPALIELNREFFINHLLKRPNVILKMAMTIDGKIADRYGDSKWLSNENSRKYVHENLRTNADAILTTHHTIIKDDARLDIRKSDGTKIDKNVLVIDRDFKLLGPENETLSIFAAHPNSTIYLFGVQKEITRIHHNNVKVIFTDFDQEGNIKLDLFFKMLLELKCYRILLEAGNKLATQLMLHDCIDEMNLFLTPKAILDRKAIGIFDVDSAIGISDAKKFELTALHQFDADVFISYQRKIY
jgi:diaminohydroxyphosphoribosylaminopyrimidine deaminase/5-amino-6-(5-phosphoribosylamino)uracil reductase